MIPASLKLANFTSYGADVPLLDFRKFRLAAISGQNGAGKSSLLDSITWNLWGTSRLGDSSDPLVKLGQNEMVVEFAFELDGSVYTVIRKRGLKSGGSTTLEFFSGSKDSPRAHNLTEGTIKATQQKIIDTLRLTYETFVNSAFIRQGHADEFTTKGATERKRILADILGLSSYDLLEEKAKEKAKEAQSKLQLLEYQLIEIEAELSQKEDNEQKKKTTEEKISLIESAILSCEKELKTILDQRESLLIINEQKIKLEQNYEENKAELEEIMLQGKNRAQRIAQLEESIKELPDIEKRTNNLRNVQKQIDKLNEARLKKVETEKQLSEVKNQLALKGQRQEQLKLEIQKIDSQMEELKKEGAKCPTCGQEIGRDHKESVKKELSGKKEKLEKELADIKTDSETKLLGELDKKLQEIPLDEGKYLANKQKVEDLDNLQKKRDVILASQASLETEKRNRIELLELYQKKQEQVKKQEEELKKTPDVSSQLEGLDKEKLEKEHQLSDLRNEEKEARSLYGQVKELILRSQQLQKLMKEKNDEKSKLAADKQAFEELALAFGKKGIQAMIIETAIPEIEDEANSLLSRLSEGRMRVRFDTQKETKSGTTVETLDIIISDEMGERPYEAFSGGEQFRVNFAIRLALSKLLTHRAGSKLQFLVIDEGFGTQDVQGRTRIVEALSVIKDEFEKILIITHLEELKEEFPVRVEVSKGPTGSTFEVVGV